VSGLWHGAAWTFIIWGALHALYQTLDLIKNRVWGVNENKTLIMRVCSILLVNIGVIFAWIFFRAGSFAALSNYLKVMFSGNFNTTFMGLCAGQGPMVLMFCILSVLLLGASYLCPRDCQFRSLKAKFIFTVITIAAIVFMGMPTGGEFIYFQF
jgi:D-alanyl-lipoteichoic acid acyltransferase DltB (MBOAT superfamily)